MYLILTMAAGFIFVGFGLFNFIRALISRDSLISQITPVRFVISGALLIAHQPLTTMITTKAETFFSEHEIEIGAELIFWLAVIVLVSVQCIVLPSWRSLMMTSVVDAMRSR